MLSLIICLGVAILCLVITILCLRMDRFGSIFEFLGWPSLVAAVIFFIASFIFSVFIVSVNIATQGLIAENEQVYKSLVYQLENNVYENDNDVGKRELYEKVTDWNAGLAKGKELQYDPWIGAFYPDIYDHLEFIELPDT